MSDRKVASGYTDIENNNSASNNSSNNNNNIINRNQAYNSISYGNTGSIHRNSMNSDMVSSAINEGVYVGGNMNSSAGQPNAMNNGHAINSTNNNNNSHTIEDSIEDVNFVISNLTVPSDMPTNVSKAYNNDTILGNEIQAYAKIAGKDWTYYVKDLNILIGRNTEAHDSKNSGPNSSSSNEIDIDLGPSKVVSRKHASINYSLNDRKWQLFMIGRNGLKVNGVRLNLAPNVPFDLTSGNIIDIGGTQMMFILPDAAPIIPQFFRDILFSNKRLKPDTALNSNRGHSSHSATNSYDHNLNPITAFQITEGLSHLHSSEGSIDQDYSTDNARDLKPPYSYATMITQAILSNPQGILSLSEIYDWISNHFAYYRHTKQGWQNSIRHNLSLNKAFEKVPRRPNEPGKGMKWQISESYRNEFLKKWQDGSLNKLKRGTSVSRQLQLHLMKNNALPSGRSISPSDDERASKPELNFYSTSDSHHHINGIKQETQFFDHSNDLNQQMSHQQLPPQQIPQQIPQQTSHSHSHSHSHSMQNLSPPKSVNELKFNSRPELTSSIKSMNIPEINKQNDLMGRNFNSQQYTVPIIRTTSENSDVNNNNNNNNNNNSNGNSRDDHTGQTSGLNHNSNNNNGSNSNNAMNALNALTSPTKKLDPKMSLMTPERRLNLEHVQQFSPNNNLNSVNSSPALWSSTYLHLSTPIQNNANVLMNNDNNDQEKLPKLELESPLKNRNLGKLSDLKDVDLAKGFKS